MWHLLLGTERSSRLLPQPETTMISSFPHLLRCPFYSRIVRLLLSSTQRVSIQISSRQGWRFRGDIELGIRNFCHPHSEIAASELVGASPEGREYGQVRPQTTQDRGPPGLRGVSSAIQSSPAASPGFLQTLMRNNLSALDHRQMVCNSKFVGVKLDIIATRTSLASSPAFRNTLDRSCVVLTQKPWVDTAKKSPFLISVPGISPHATRMSKGRL